MAINPQLVSALLGMQSGPGSAMAGGMGGAAGMMSALPFLAAGATIQKADRANAGQVSPQQRQMQMASQFQNQEFNYAGMSIPALQAHRRMLQDQGRLTPEVSTAIFNAVQAQQGM